MIKKKTTLILGAGASFPYGFPTGPRLMVEIVERTADVGGNTRALLRAAGGSDGDIEKLRSALSSTQLNSIDSVLEHRPNLIPVGKLAIAAVLIPCEDPAHLRPSDTAQHWYRKLFNSLMDGGFDGSKLTVVTLNYDRSLEQYLFETISKEFELAPADAAKRVRTIKFVHFHGQLGRLPWWPSEKQDIEGATNHGSEKPYSTNLSPEILRAAAESIRIVSEFDQARLASVVQPIQADLETTEVIGLLGFGYHQTVMDRLELSRVSAAKEILQIFGSAYGVPKGRRDELHSLFPGMVVGAPEHSVSDFLDDCILLFQGGSGQGGPGSRLYANHQARRGVLVNG